jgi:hypothetical protein
MATGKGFFENPLAEYEAFLTYGSFQEQTNLIGSLNKNYDDISEEIKVYNNTLGSMKDYVDFSNNSLTDKSNVWLDKVDRKSDVKDGVKDDIQIMILQQNNAYIIGMITLTTVLITTYLVIK